MVGGRAKASKTPADWAAMAAVALPALHPARSADLHPGADFDALAFDGLTAEEADADGARFLECRFSDCQFGSFRLRRSTLSGCVLEDVRTPVLDAADSTWREVAVRRGRLGAFIAPGVDLLRVTVDGGRLDYVNLRGANLTQVQFLDCRIAELDVGAAQLAQVRFRGCQLDRLVLTAAALQDVDLRGAQLAAVDGVDRLAGAVLTPEQLVQVAPALAASMGIRVADPASATRP